MTQSYSKHTLAGVVVEPDQQYPESHQREALPGNPWCIPTSLNKRYDVPDGPDEP